ncbi:SIN3-HDAC complex-associated factor-like [Diorhabda sublineata]|uniref:SIN3-HDAC complex-associated factor-like n=1 Tax=Diorhabda sublineata TaxID=1163346 RepID=UPI0024E191D7|nr:SIN3-HDAC complex-associated factor-like [Diorhabda sublineata]
MFSRPKMQLWYPKRHLPDQLVQQRKCTSDSTESDSSDIDIRNYKLTRPNKTKRSDMDAEENTSKIQKINMRDERKTGKDDENGTKENGFVDLEYWTQEKICCGTIFRGKYDEVMFDPRSMKPCENRLKKSITNVDSNENKI